MAKAVPIHLLTQPEAPLRASAPVLLVRIQEMMEFATAARDPANVTELHDMRIAGKRLRYTLELFAPVLGGRAFEVLGTVEQIQELLGSIHDCDVLIPLLEQTIDQETEREQKQATRKGGGLPQYLAAEGLAKLLGEKREERDRLYREFLALWDSLPAERFAQDVARLICPPDAAA